MMMLDTPSARLLSPDEKLNLKKNRPALKVFLLGLILATVIFVPFVIIDRGYFTYYGDFNVQQIPFYQVMHDAFRSGEFGWNFNIDLGSNFIGNNAFYMIGSPFFWFTLIFPNSFVPHLMAPLLILKIALCGMTAFLYLKRFLSEDFAVIGGLLYAFSGISVYNIFFNHFHESLLVFPLMMLGMERLMVDNKRGLFAITVFFSAINNYYLFVGQCVFLILYFLVRTFTRGWKMSLPKFLSIFFEAIAGTAMAAFILLPAFLSVIQNPRTGADQQIVGWDVLIHSSPQRFFDIIQSFFFPQALPARVSFFPESNNRWASMSAWMPVFGFTGVIAYFQSRKHNDWLKRFIAILIFIALIPGLNAMFHLMKSVYYARWFYMMVMFLILATLKCFDEGRKIHVEWNRAIKLTALVMAFFGLVIGLVPKSLEKNAETGKLEIGLFGDFGFFMVAIVFGVVCLVLTGTLVSIYKSNSRRNFVRWCTAMVCAVSLIFGLYSVGVGKFQSYYDNNFIIDKAINGGDKIDITRTNDSRVDFYDDMQNMGMFWKMPAIQAFHSVVPGSIHEFYESLGIDRYVNSNPEISRYGIRGVLSVEWIFKYKKDAASMSEEDYKKHVNDFEAFPGLTYYDTQNDYEIYKNDNFIPYGFTYDKYISRTDFNKLTSSSRELAMLKAIVLEDKDVEKYKHLYDNLLNHAPIYNKSEYAKDCEERQAGAANRFIRQKNGFQSNITVAEETLVFFSIPHEAGWRATVNGKEAEIVKSNVGFMSVLCEPGDDIIQFHYTTPGLNTGLKAAGAAAVAFIIYLVVFAVVTDKKKKNKRGVPLQINSLSDADQKFEVINNDYADSENFDLYDYYSNDDEEKASDQDGTE